MNNFTPELIAKAKAAESAEELLALAKENNVELTEEEAKVCFEQLHANGAVSDDDLEAVAGGGALCDFFENFFLGKNGGNDDSCPNCGENQKTATAPEKSAVKGTIIPLPYEILPGDPKDKNKIIFL